MNIKTLQKDLSKLMKKHNICIGGQVFINDFDPERYEEGCILNMHGNGVLMDINLIIKPQIEVKKKTSPLIEAHAA